MLVLNEIECAQWMEMVNLIEMSVFTFFNRNPRILSSKKGDLIAFNVAFSSENFTYILQPLP